MIISQIEIENFKSYYGKHIIGPLDSHFNCVIGPNGNGKSNIIDAVLFVFGFKSSKLRLDNLTSLIHCSAFARPNFCTVGVAFGDGQKVSRTIR
jgi:structural maintenance of chromosome 4